MTLPAILHNRVALRTLSLPDRTPYSATTRFLSDRIEKGEVPLGTLRVRVGVALQRKRQTQGLSQAQLANLSEMSLKYVGEIERGEANVSMETLERIATALEWDPFDVPLREQDTLPEGVRTLLLAELTHMQHLVQTAIGWVQTLDAAMVRRTTQPPSDIPPRVRVGRPRKPKPEPSSAAAAPPASPARPELPAADRDDDTPEF